MYDTLVLPGGGMKGFILLGSLQYCIDNNILQNIKKFIGTSIGSILCYLLCIGYSPIEIVTYIHLTKYIEKTSNFNILDMINSKGAVTFNHIQEGLEKMTIEKIGKFLTLGKLKEEFGKELYCVTYNMTVCTTEYINCNTHPDMPCLTALRLSCNLPLIFERFKYMDNYYIDGGVSDNFPIEKAKEIGEKILALELKINEKSFKDEPSEGMMSYLLKIFQIFSKNIKRNYDIDEKCCIIPLDTTDVLNAFDFGINSKIKLDMFSCGYESTKQFFKTIDIKNNSNLLQG